MTIAIIGAGPSGLYAAEAILKQSDSIHVDVFDALPVPYGLLRYGVAPDHQKIKKLDTAFEKILASKNCRFIGNCRIGQDVALADIQARYEAVILASGARHSKTISVSGSSLEGVIPASDFVAWYNGYPDLKRPVMPSTFRDIGIIGCGNVSMDLVRILATDPKVLAATDMPQHVVDYFSTLNVRSITIFGRRGPLQATVTPHELEECLSLATINPTIDLTMLEQSVTDHQDMGLSLSSSQEKLLNCFRSIPNHAVENGVQLDFQFFKNTVSFEGTDTLTAITMEETALSDGEDVANIRYMANRQSYPLDAVFFSVGYQPDRWDGLVYQANGGLSHREGAVLDANQVLIPGLYAVGWAKRGATGVIGLNRSCAKETVRTLFSKQMVSDTVVSLEELLSGLSMQTTSFRDWLHINQHELLLGESLSKVREKLCSRDDIFRVLKN